MKNMVCRLIAGALLLLGATLTNDGFAAPAQVSVPRDSKFEASWTLPNQTGNPFDPQQNDIQAAFHTPSGKTVMVPAFWDGDKWRVRYTPLTIGKYTLTVLRSGTPIHPADLSAAGFRCTSSSAVGFIRRDPAHVQHFLFDNKNPYYPIGMDYAWGGGNMPDYPEIFQTMHQNGMTWTRIWMNNWDGKNLEWGPDRSQNPPIGQYSMDVARKWDTIVNAAEKNDVYIQLCLQHHGQYTQQTDPNWADNPFNVANGGFLKNPEDFFTDPTALRLTRNKFRYIVARWGYSPHLMSFELFNEVQNIGEVRDHFENVVNWHRQMAAYIRSLDPNHHLITTSNSPPDSPLAKIGLDYDQIHTYVPSILSYFLSQSVAGVNTPVFLGEWGENGRQTESALHDGLWSGIMVPAAGAPQYWYWDQVQPQNWWGQYKAVTSYIKASHMAAQTNLHSVPVHATSSGNRATLSFTPSGGFGPTTSFDITADPSGAISGLSGVSSFIMGQNHRDMLPKPISIHLQCAQACKFQIQIATIARAGAHPQISVDGTLAAEKDYPAGDRDQNIADTLSADLTPGAHTVTLFNSGADWFIARSISVTDYSPALAATAKGNNHAIFFWAYSRDRSTEPISGSILLAGLAPGAYQLHLWNTQTGQPLGTPKTLRVMKDPLSISLPAFSKDIAGWITPARP